MGHTWDTRGPGVHHAADSAAFRYGHCRQRRTKQQTGQANMGKFNSSQYWFLTISPSPDYTTQWVYCCVVHIQKRKSPTDVPTPTTIWFCVYLCVCEQNSTAWSFKAAAATTVWTVMPACLVFRATGATLRGEWPAGLSASRDCCRTPWESATSRYYNSTWLVLAGTFT